MGEESGQIVICHSGFRYGERPLSFTWQGRCYGVKHIIASWRIPEGPAFRVLAHTDDVFELQYLEDQDEWQIKTC